MWILKSFLWCKCLLVWFLNFVKVFLNFGESILQNFRQIGIGLLLIALWMMSLQPSKNYPVSILLSMITQVLTHYFYDPNLNGGRMKMFGSWHFWLAVINYDWFFTIWLVILFFERKKFSNKNGWKVGIIWIKALVPWKYNMEVTNHQDLTSHFPFFSCLLFCFEVHLLLLLICDFIQGFHVLFCCIFVGIIKLIDI